MQGTVHEFDPASGSGSVLLDDGRRVPFGKDAFGRSDLRMLRVGQRLTLDTAPDAGVPAEQIAGLRIVGI